MEELIKKIKETPKAPDVEDIYYPGELDAVNEARHQRYGILFRKKPYTILMWKLANLE